MWQPKPSGTTEFLVVIPEVGGLRSRSARRLVEDDESQRRRDVEADEASHRSALCGHHVTVMQRALQAQHTRNYAPTDQWERKTLRAFEIAENEQLTAACSEYTATGTLWMPHDVLRTIYGEWRHYYNRWKKPHVMASSLLASFFCSMLIDDTLTTPQQIDLSREIVNATLEITNDAEDTAAEAVTYNAFVLLVKNLSTVLFAPKHPYVTTHLLAVVLDERIHRTQE